MNIRQTYWRLKSPGDSLYYVRKYKKIELPWEEIICYLSNLKYLFCGISCEEILLKNVAQFCPNIEEIHAKNCVSFKSVRYFCRNGKGEFPCSKLKKLCINMNAIWMEDVFYLLKNLPNLEVIDYPTLPIALYQLHKNDLSSLDKVPPYNFIKLDITKKNFCDEILKVCFTVCPYLKYLTWCLYRKDELSLFPNICCLEVLSIQNNSNEEINIDEFLNTKCSTLTSLEARSFTVSVSILAKSCPQLQNLKLKYCHFILNESSKSMFDSSCITFENLYSFEDLRATNLKSIAFLGCNLLSSEIKAFILKCCKQCPIKEVSFCESNIEKEFIKELLLNGILTYLNIQMCFEDKEDEEEILEYAKSLPNKPEIEVS